MGKADHLLAAEQIAVTKDREPHRMLKLTIRIVIFCALFFVLLLGIQRVFQPKWESGLNSYARVRFFYRETPAPEVVFVGSSHAFYGINPLVIFREQGIASYDFASFSLGMSAMDFYVEEAIRVHSPKIIVIEPLRLMTLISSEQRTRQWFDPIPLSINKIVKAQEVIEINERFKAVSEHDSLLSYAFPLLRYHDRWEELTPTSFFIDPEMNNYHGAIHYHGYGPHYQTTQADFSKYEEKVSFDPELLSVFKNCFEKAVMACRENHVELLLLKTPSPAWRKDYHDMVTTWAEEYEVPFVDCNNDMERIGIDVETDFLDEDHHLNDSGATKLSHYIAQYLRDNYDLPDHRGDPDYDSWNDDWQIYQQDKASYFLSHETDWASYLEKLKNPNYSVFMAAKDSLGADQYPELPAMLCELGLTPELEYAARTGYIAVIDSGEIVFEQLEDIPLNYEDELSGHHVKVYSSSYNQGNYASIEFDWKERPLNQRGLTIVVYDKILDDVVDCVTFDLYDGGKAYR